MTCVFIQQYAAVNRLTFDKTKRDQTDYLNKALQLPAAAKSCCSLLTIRELDAAIHGMRSKDTAGLDGIPLAFLKAFCLIAKAERLPIFNETPFCRYTKCRKDELGQHDHRVSIQKGGGRE